MIDNDKIKVKIFITENYYDYDDEKSLKNVDSTEWETITKDEFEFLLKNRYNLRELISSEYKNKDNIYVSIIAQDNFSSTARISELVKILTEKEKEKAEKLAKQKEKAALAKLAKKKKTEEEEKKLLEILQKKYQTSGETSI